MRTLLPILALTVAAGCVRPPAAPPPQAPAVEGPVAVAPTSTDWRDWPLTPGTWRYQQAGGVSLAQYKMPGAVPVMSLRCDLAAHTVALVRPAAAAVPATIHTTSMTRALAAGAALPARDPLLDAMAFSRGRFVVEQAGAATLVLPAWAEIGRVIEDCRG